MVDMTPVQMFEILSQMKVTIAQDPAAARLVLINNPGLTKALFQAQIALGMVQPPPTLTPAPRARSATPVQQNGAQSTTNSQQSRPTPAQQQQQHQPPSKPKQQPPPAQPQQQAATQPPSASQPTPSAPKPVPSRQQQQQAPPPPPPPPSQPGSTTGTAAVPGPRPGPAPGPAAASGMTVAQQKTLLTAVMAMSQDQINALPAVQREQVIALRLTALNAASGK